ncbi:hypothetical protein [Stieleria mannarensis]|uniref:hypothetical protein n=1 Tax=Stieleria mannarensis TaxID=2755585 RepID=UPI001603FDB8|nr:hypothetical protein [Rhodopirellula sp. JC639]
MIRANVVERHPSYLAGQFPKAIRFAPEFRTGEFEFVEVDTKPARRAATVFRSIDPDNLRPSGLHLWWNLGKFKMGRYPFPYGDHWAAYIQARWDSGDHHAVRCPYGRLHTLLTQTPRNTRGGLTTEHGEKLCNVDVACCQLLLTGLAAATAYSNNNTACHTNVMSRIFSSRGAHGLSTSIPDDVAEWIRLCETGQIYPYMQDRVRQFDEPAWQWIERDNGKRMRIDMRDASAKQIKRATLIPMFDRQARAEANPVFQVILEDFPGIARFVRQVKREKHEALACLLQGLESFIMIDRVGNRMRTHFQDEILQSIHDAMIVRVGFGETMSEIIKDEFSRFGVSPTVKTGSL